MAATSEPARGDSFVLEPSALQPLLDAIAAEGYQIRAPHVRDHAVCLDEVTRIEQLPIGWSDKQDGGLYRLERRDSPAFFGCGVGQDSWKKLLHRPWTELWKAGRANGQLQLSEPNEEPARFAFFGVRPCDLAAIRIQDTILATSRYPDPFYRARREGLLVVVANCASAGGTCFCASMGTGPRARSGFDLALTELLSESGHAFLVEVGSDVGARLLSRVPRNPAGEAERAAADAATQRAIEQMGRRLDTDDIHGLLMGNLEHPRWNQVARRCLTCGNCTLVCPTCFCTNFEDGSDLEARQAVRTRRWDSCFTLGFSRLRTGPVRPSVRSRYRQWMTHKLATWFDQFGSSGCVGCGRCITWCPVGIDITEESAAIRASDRRIRE
jgi:ferredoxin